MTDKLTIIICGACGWRSKELTRDEVAALGVPWYCDDCGKQAKRYVTFSQDKATEARRIADVFQRWATTRK